MNRVAIYARVSSEQQAQQQTIESQLAALHERVKDDGHVLLPHDVFVDDGVSGATLVRPGLEKLRDRIAERLIDVLYVHGPDRLARKYAYQVLLLEEFRASGVKVTFLNATSIQSAEDELLVQVQGMIAEYERAKIVERGRRGRIFRARQGSINALSCAPFGYAYQARSATAPASMQIVLHEARVVRSIFEAVVHEQKSIAAIVRTLNANGVSPRRGSHWSRSTVGQMLKNTAYMGKAAFGKTRVAERVPARPRPLRGQSVVSNRTQQRQAAEEWIFIDVPPIISPELFQAAAEQLTRNRELSPRRAQPRRYLLQGLAVCANCGYAAYGTTTTSGNGKWARSYYRCGGRDPARSPKGRVCSVLPVRADLLDERVWQSVCQILENPQRLHDEWSRRADNSQALSGLQAQCDDLARMLSTQERSLKRLIDAYEIGALALDDLKQRTHQIRERIGRTRRDLQDACEQLDNTQHLRAIIARLKDFSARVSTRLKKLEWGERQLLIRTLVAKVEINHDGATIVYRLSPLREPSPFSGGSGGPSGGARTNKMYALCPRDLDEIAIEARADAALSMMANTSSKNAEPGPTRVLADVVDWRAPQDSNLRPPDSKSGALSS
jgi:site-specific DNA recombinase